MSEVFEVGIVGINEGLIFIMLVFFGGIKELGFGREGVKYGFEEYFEVKYIFMGGLV